MMLNRQPLFDADERIKNPITKQASSQYYLHPIKHHIKKERRFENTLVKNIAHITLVGWSISLIEALTNQTIVHELYLGSLLVAGSFFLAFYKSIIE